MTSPINNDQPLWEPSATTIEQANVTRYMQWLVQEKGLGRGKPSPYTREEVWQWSVNQLEDFWASIWDFFHIQASQPYETVLTSHKMPGASWFPGAQLNYAEHVFRHATTQRPALLFRSERHPSIAISWHELSQQVGSVANALRQRGVRVGDRVVAYMPNIPQTVVAFLACASIGAIWSSCSPDFGTKSVIERFQQIEPVVLFAVDGYQYNGKVFDRRPIIAELQQALPTLHTIVLVPYLAEESEDGLSVPHLAEESELGQGSHKTQTSQDVISWSEMLKQPGELSFEQVPFQHPLWVLYSSGTTGLPKAIVQGHGGILLEHLKNLTFDVNLKPGDRFFWFTTTGWMMWNLLLAGLLVEATIVLYDGSPTYPDTGTLWQFVQDAEITFFGTSAAFIASCMKAGIEPSQHYDLHKVLGIGSTGSPLPPEGFIWLYEHVKRDLWVASLSGGTDVCSAFVSGSVVLPVYAGELQCRSFGAKVEAFDEYGHSVIDEVGELVITEPLPSMPLFFWNDPGNRRYRESYFSQYLGVWRHGDWIKITPRGSAIISGRSDSTINRMGIRMGSSEIYRVVESLPEVMDSLVVGVELPHGQYYMPLFVVLRAKTVLDEDLKARIRTALRTQISPHHVPDEIIEIPEVPRTLSGKKMEVPIKKLLMGIPIEKAASIDAMSNPEALQYFLGKVQKH